MNLVPIFLSQVAVKGLVDSGSARSILSLKMLNKIKRNKGKMKVVNDGQLKRLYTADDSPMEILHEV